MMDVRAEQNGFSVKERKKERKKFLRDRTKILLLEREKGKEKEF